MSELSLVNQQLARQGCPRIARAMQDMYDATCEESTWAIYIAAFPRGGWSIAGVPPKMTSGQKAMTMRMIRRLKEAWLPDVSWEDIEDAPGRVFEGNTQET